jgi:hypothetical protein
MMRNLYIDFKHLLTYGNINQHLRIPSFLIVSTTIILLTLIINIVFVIISHQFTTYFSLSIYKSYMYQKETIYTLVNAVVVAPILEETCTRYPLKKEKLGLILFFTIILYYIIPYMTKLSQSERILYTILIFALFCIVLLKNKFYESFLNEFYQNPKIILYTLSIVFGIMHIIDYNFSLKLLCVLIFLIFPYFLSGLMFSYVRLRFSLSHSILLHAFNNFVIAFPAFLLNYK